MLQGYKTYVVAFLAVLGAVAGYLTGDLSLGDAIQTGVTAILAATVRHGVSTSKAPSQ